MTEVQEDLFVVAVGASAGGLDALSRLIERIHVPSIAVVIVQHGKAEDSNLPELVGRSGWTKVISVEEGTLVEAGNVYVVPPACEVAILHGTFHLMTTASHLPIDYFMRSLAEDIGWRAIGVVLSGTGSDGTLGLKSIKEQGGITFVQAPDSAEYDGMPRSAIESGYADFSLPPEELATEIVYVAKHPYRSRTGTRLPRSSPALSKLAVLVRARFGNDLTHYKPGTLERRIERRMTLHKIERLEDYVRYVQGTDEELTALYRDILIGVTAFFRDRDPFEVLRREVFPKLIAEKPPGSTIRMWIPACSTGEEVYSLAIELLELLDGRAADYRIQIFGTDIDENAVQRARRGMYPDNITLDVPRDRLNRYFVKKEDGYQVVSRVREMVVFSVQNLVQDAPFSKLDLVSCRNLLIYLQPLVQKKVLQILHYALQPNGILMVGTSESVGELSELFSLIDRQSKIYMKRSVSSLPVPEFGFGAKAGEPIRAQREQVMRPELGVATLVERRILELYAPAGIVVNRDLDVVHIRGRTGPYLEPMPGAPSFNLLKLARAELHVDLRRAVHESQTKNERVVVESQLQLADSTRHFRLEVLPLTELKQSGHSLVVFHPPAEPDDSPQKALDPATAEQDQLQRELTLTKEYLQNAIEELESSNEELKSSNEELQSSNEELQSTNEELETSKEELQSTNEELTTVNDELQSRMNELQQTNEDLHNVLSGIGKPIVLIGMDLRIRRFTQTAERLFNLVPHDVGRSVSQLNSFISGKHVEELAMQVIERLVPHKLDVLCVDQRWYELSITPYRTLDRSIKGAMLVLTDIDAIKRRGEVERDIARFVAGLFQAVKEPLIVVDDNGRPLWRNASFTTVFGEHSWKNPSLEDRLASLVAYGTAFDSLSVEYVLETRSQTFLVSGSRMPSLGDSPPLFAITFVRPTNAHERSP